MDHRYNKGAVGGEQVRGGRSARPMRLADKYAAEDWAGWDAVIAAMASGEIQKGSGWFADQGEKAIEAYKSADYDTVERILAEARERFDSKGQGKGKGKDKPKSGRFPL
jgi:hypothetical protein